MCPYTVEKFLVAFGPEISITVYSVWACTMYSRYVMGYYMASLVKYQGFVKAVVRGEPQVRPADLCCPCWHALQ